METQVPCCIKDCSSIATFSNRIAGRFWEYTHNYCSQHYEKLVHGEMGLEIDRGKVPLERRASAC